jgi:hypothetical protein
MANTDRTRKLLVRSALATSTTIATFIGAQNLAMLDINQFSFTEPTAIESVTTTMTADTTGSQVLIQAAAPNLVIQRAAPSIIILRQPGTQTATTAGQPITMAIQPPSPSQLAAPAPVIVQQSGATTFVQQPSQPSAVVAQQPAPQRSKSSR